MKRTQQQQQQQQAEVKEAPRPCQGRSDEELLREEYQFIRSSDSSSSSAAATKRSSSSSQQQKMRAMAYAKKYEDKLFKEYAIADLSRVCESAEAQIRRKQVGMRWRTAEEVLRGKGQSICGAKGCDSESELTNYEVNFQYLEHGEMKQALVKLVLCPSCAMKMGCKAKISSSPPPSVCGPSEPENKRQKIPPCITNTTRSTIEIKQEPKDN